MNQSKIYIYQHIYSAIIQSNHSLSNSPYHTTYNNVNEKKQHTYQSKYRNNQLTEYKITTISQPYKVIASCQIANIILAKLINITRNNIQI